MRSLPIVLALLASVACLPQDAPAPQKAEPALSHGHTRQQIFSNKVTCAGLAEAFRKQACEGERFCVVMNDYWPERETCLIRHSVTSFDSGKKYCLEMVFDALTEGTVVEPVTDCGDGTVENWWNARWQFREEGS